LKLTPRLHTRNIFVVLLCLQFHHAKAQFFAQYWATFDEKISNSENPKERLRAHDQFSTIDPGYSKTHREAHINGLQLITVNEVISDIKRAEVLFEMWGGHPLTENKRFTINGRGTYHLPGHENTLEQTEYIYPTIPITASNMVNGVNAFQIACDRGTTWWGTFIVDEMAVRCYLKDDDKRIADNGLTTFAAIPSVGKIEDITTVQLLVAPAFEQQITQVHFIARYDGYDDRGDGYGNGWHGFTQKRVYTNHVGTATEAPFKVNWDTKMIPTQGKAMAIKAIIEFKNGLCYESEVLDNLWFPKKRPTVLLIHSTNASVPYWTRDKKLKTNKITLPVDPKEIASAELQVKIWDGGEGDVKEPFKLNGIAYPVTSKKADHMPHLTKHIVEPTNLKLGENTVELFSDTQHHGIEMMLPFPALIIRLKDK
jgi:hypothetical protein